MGRELSSIISNRNQELISSIDDKKVLSVGRPLFDEDGEIMAAIHATVSWCKLMDLVCGGGGGVIFVTNVLLSIILNAYVCLGVGAVGGRGL